jgi:D-amino-acid dehydrogenase
MADTAEVAVIGAGLIGATTALRLAVEGREVVLIDPEAPGSGASHGNAGTVADYAVRPVGTPSVLRHLPSLLLDHDSPLAIRKAAILSLAPWLARFLVQSLPGPAERNALALAAIVAGASERWQELAVEADAQDLMRARGCLYAYGSQAEFRSAQSDLAGRKAMGVDLELVDPAVLAALEPGYPTVEGGAAFFPKSLSVLDPGEMTRRIALAAVDRHCASLSAKVGRLDRVEGGVKLTGARLSLTAKKVIIAAGAHSLPLAQMAGDRIPLDTERGYHLEFDGQENRLSRPVCPTDRAFYFSPMKGRLRAAGTVELGGLTAPPSTHRLAALERGVRSVFPDLPPPSRTWMGFRPSIPDSLPVIGPSRGGLEVIHAFGHGHIGLTLAPVTAEIVADLVAGRTPRVELSPFRANRF